MRREREACQAPGLRVVGTSATLATEGSYLEQRGAVAEVASRLFGAELTAEDIIGETLVAATQDLELSAESTTAALRETVEAAHPPTDYDAAVADPLARWLERTVGVRYDHADERLERCAPLPLGGSDGIAAQLAALTGLDPGVCEGALRATLMAGSSILRPDNGFPVFAFRLHQFLSGGASVAATLAPESERKISTSGQRFAPGSGDLDLLRRCWTSGHPDVSEGFREGGRRLFAGGGQATWRRCSTPNRRRSRRARLATSTCASRRRSSATSTGCGEDAVTARILGRVSTHR